MGTKLSATARYKRWEPILKRVSITLVTLLVIYFGIYLYVTKRSIYHPKPFDQQKFDQIVADIQSGKLKADGPIVVLPPDLAGASVTGRAYVTKDLIFIPSWVGRKTLVCGQASSCDEWIGGYVYSGAPLNTGPVPLPSTLNAPAFCEPSKTSEDDIAQNIDLVIYSPVSAHWYTADSWAPGQPL